MTYEPRHDPLWWFEDAACNDMDRDLFLRTTNQHTRRFAIDICNTCPVAEICLCYGMSLEQPGARYGIFGGMTSAQRELLGIPQELARSSYEVERRFHWERTRAT